MVDPKFLRNMRFGKKYKKGLKKMQGNNAKVMSARAQAIKALVKPKIPKGGSCKLSQLAYITYFKLEKCAHARIALLAKVQGQGSNQGPWLWLQLCLQLKLRLRLPKVLGPHKGPRLEDSVCRCEERRIGVTPALPSAWRWRPPVAICLNTPEAGSVKKECRQVHSPQSCH
ncbi:hypothetical protein mRhiFer1_010149 [Rhinolophus ferrumequinum]|uniref:60S ribosomal protein L29 n=1 Tax=Rhinolophus ferrumequinum TaxID=59479 RepID=A0A7J7XPJ5_RHIFE|nr:hypothetical protein mRhiFer1_010149 [Rhinolophus ferrumequinum]